MAAARTDPPTVNQSPSPCEPQLDRVAEVERLPVLERCAVRAHAASPTRCSSTGAQKAALFTWRSRSTSVARRCQSRRVASSGGPRQHEAGRGAPSRRRLAVDRQEPLAETLRLQVGPEMDPRHLGVDAPAAVARQRRAAESGRGGRPAAPCAQLDLGVVEERLRHVEHGPPHDPDVLVGRPAGVEHVVGGDVLQVARDRIEPQPAARVGVGEADRAPGAVAARRHGSSSRTRSSTADGDRGVRRPRRDARRRRRPR